MRRICCEIMQRGRFALAEKARQKGHPDYADEPTSLACGSGTLERSKGGSALKRITNQ